MLDFAKRVFGSRDVAAPEAERSQLVQPDRDMGGVPARQLVASTRGLDLRLFPVTSQLEDLGSVDAAVAGELARTERYRPAPNLGDPFRGAAVVAERGARADGAAVGRRRRPRPEQPTDRTGHDLVEERQPFVDAPEMDERATLLEDTQRLDVPITEHATDLDRALRIAQCLLAVAEQLARHDALDPRQPPLLHALGEIGQERGGALQPAGGHGESLPARVVEREMEGHEGSGSDVTFLDQSGVGALPRFDALLEMAHPERSLGESFHIARLECTGAVGLSEEREPLRPVAGVDRSASAVDQLAQESSLVALASSGSCGPGRPSRRAPRPELALVSTACPCRRGSASST